MPISTVSLAGPGSSQALDSWGPGPLSPEKAHSPPQEVRSCAGFPGAAKRFPLMAVLPPHMPTCPVPAPTHVLSLHPLVREKANKEKKKRSTSVQCRQQAQVQALGHPEGGVSLQVWGSILQGLPPLGRVLLRCLAEQRARTPHPGTPVSALKESAGRPVALQDCLTPLLSGNMSSQSLPTPASWQQITCSTGHAQQCPRGRPDRQVSSSGMQRVASHGLRETVLAYPPPPPAASVPLQYSCRSSAQVLPGPVETPG